MRLLQMADTDKSLHKCVLCDFVCESKEELQTHFRKHANKEIDNNGTPSKAKTPKRVFKKEVLISKTTKAKVIACDVCGQEFTDNARAIQHKYKKHPDVSNKYVCPYCGSQFPIKALFDNHLNNHKADKRKKASLHCEECGAEFYFLEAKEYHNKTTHKRVKTLFQPIPTPPPSKKIKVNNLGEVQSVYYCHLCGFEYVLKFNLQEHLKNIHTEEERNVVPKDLIRCTTCDAIFCNAKAYETHDFSHKTDDLYVTSEEQRLQAVTKVDLDFDIRRVIPLTHKYIPSFTRKRKKNIGYRIKQDLDVNEEKLSPPSTPEPTDSDSDSDLPLVKLKEKTEDKKPTVLSSS